MKYYLKDAIESDLASADEVAVAAFRQYSEEYDDWTAFSRNTKPMTSLFKSAELIVAAVEDRIVGAVAYVGPGKLKGELFPAEWPVLRMLVVAPECRGRGIGRALSSECVRRALRDKASVIALLTSKIMTVALSMYERMGFCFERNVPPIYGVPYAVYVKHLDQNCA